MDCLTHATDVTSGPIINCAIVESKVHIIDELLNMRVLVLSHLGFNRLEVHGLLNYGTVVVQAQSDGVYWSCKQPSVFLSREILQNSFGSFFPVGINRSTFRHFWYF